MTLWNVLQKWISALPETDCDERERKETLQTEFEKLMAGVDEGGYGIKGQDGGMGMIVGHCDLLNGNVIILPEEDGVAPVPGATKKVHFIDYEYAPLLNIACNDTDRADTPPPANAPSTSRTTSPNGAASTATSPYSLLGPSAANSSKPISPPSTSTATATAAQQWRARSRV